MTHPNEHARLVVLMTSHNRRETTLMCLQALFASQSIESLSMDVILVDDGSTDGTEEAVVELFSKVRVVRGDGSLYWCRGMYLAFEQAMNNHYDYYLWLNDDTMLYPDSLSRLLSIQKQLRKNTDKPVIVVGSTQDKTTGILTYGGESRPVWWKRTTFVKVKPGIEPLHCDSMNGNVVLIPDESAKIVGNLEPAFEHAMGDTDYALRANRLGVAVWLAPGMHGVCGHNTITGTYLDTTLSIQKRWKLMLGRKGLPWRSWLLFTYRHAGPLWPFFFLWPFVRLIYTSVICRHTTGFEEPAKEK